MRCKMRKIILFISMLVMFTFLVSCAPQELTDEELEAELGKLTPEERAELLNDLEAKESGALAGQASYRVFTEKYAGKAPTLANYVTRAPPSQLARVRPVTQRF